MSQLTYYFYSVSLWDFVDRVFFSTKGATILQPSPSVHCHLVKLTFANHWTGFFFSQRHGATEKKVNSFSLWLRASVREYSFSGLAKWLWSVGRESAEISNKACRAAILKKP